MDRTEGILIAIDDSEASRRAVAYVARVMGGRKGVRIRLFHALAPLPPRLVDFPVGEDPRSAWKRDAEAKDARAAWVTQGKKAAQAVFARAKTILRRARIPARVVEVQVATPSSDQDLATVILEAARAGQCGTIVVGRETYAGLRELFRRHVHVADDLIQKAQGLALWVVE
jgi:hypothetical protein